MTSQSALDTLCSMFHTKTQKKTPFLQLLSLSWPTFLGYLFFGMSYGYLMNQRGIPWWGTLLFSLLVFGGSIQMMALAWLVHPLPLIQTTLIAFLVNARHVFYSLKRRSIPLKSKLSELWSFFTLSDETFTTLEMNPHLDSSSILILSTLHYLYWSGATLLGHLLGSRLTIQLQGLEFILTALFFTAFLNQVTSSKTSITALMGLMISAVSFMILPLVAALTVSLISLLGLTFIMVYRRSS